MSTCEAAELTAVRAWEFFVKDLVLVKHYTIKRIFLLMKDHLYAKEICLGLTECGGSGSFLVFHGFFTDLIRYVLHILLEK